MKLKHVNVWQWCIYRVCRLWAGWSSPWSLNMQTTFSKDLPPRCQSSRPLSFPIFSWTTSTPQGNLVNAKGTDCKIVSWVHLINLFLRPPQDVLRGGRAGDCCYVSLQLRAQTCQQRHQSVVGEMGGACCWWRGAGRSRTLWFRTCTNHLTTQTTTEKQRLLFTKEKRKYFGVHFFSKVKPTEQAVEPNCPASTQRGSKIKCMHILKELKDSHGGNT